MNFSELETVCQACGGSRYVASSGLVNSLFGMRIGIKKVCKACDGKGYNLTDQGRQLVEFVMRHVTTGIDVGGLRPKGITR